MSMENIKYSVKYLYKKIDKLNNIYWYIIFKIDMYLTFQNTHHHTSLPKERKKALQNPPDCLSKSSNLLH